MILGEPHFETLPATTLDAILRRTAARRPNAIALADPPNRASFTDAPLRRLTYAEADRMVSAIAARLRALGLRTDAIVGMQLPNTVESVLALLGVLRAGMIAAPLPLLWHRADAAKALGPLDASAIIATSRIGDFDACGIAMQVAADIFSIRHVCCFGRNLPDGVIGFDDVLNDATPEAPDRIEREGHPAAHVALVTFDVAPAGLVPVARNHAELMAGGLATLLEGGIAPDSCLLGCCATGSFGGLALTVLPWLLSGGTLLLHHGFDPDAFAAQSREYGCDTVVVPGPLVGQLAEAGLLSHVALKNTLAAWRAPERFMSSPPWQHASTRITDMLIFGETAVVGSRRGTDGRPVPLPDRAVTAPSGSPDAVVVAEIALTQTGTLALRGPMVPQRAFPAGNESSPRFEVDTEGFVDTHHACRIDRTNGTATVTGPPPGIVSVGSYRFMLRDLEDVTRRAKGGAFVTALPDAIAGHRLAGISSGVGDLREAFAELGVNPLVADAFETA